jgi:hypothetical protein
MKLMINWDELKHAHAELKLLAVILQAKAVVLNLFEWRPTWVTNPHKIASK